MLVFNTPSGSMTSGILVKILQHIDKLEVFERRDDLPPPGFLVDGHGSRFGLDFLSYINNTDVQGNPLADVNHRWNAYLGLPYSTGLWQVGDAPEQNGNYKYGLRDEGAVICSLQRRHGESVGLKIHDIIPMVMKAFLRSFGNIETNKKAIAERGWNPMNRNCLLDDEVVKGKKGIYRYDSEDELDEEIKNGPGSRNNGNVSSTVACVSTDNPNDGIVQTSLAQLHERNAYGMTASEFMVRNTPDVVDGLNVSTERALDLFSIIQTSKRRNIALENEHVAYRKRQKDDRLTTLEVHTTKQTGRIGAGTEVRMGNYSLNDPNLATAVRVKKVEKELKSTSMTMKLYKKKKNEYDLGIKVLGIKRKWTLYQYGHMINFKQLHFRKRLKTDSTTEGQQIRKSLPTTIRDRMLLWETYKNYQDPNPPIEPTGYKEWLQQDVLNDIAKKRKKFEVAQAEGASANEAREPTDKPTIMDV